MHNQLNINFFPVDVTTKIEPSFVKQTVSEIQVSKK
jgi:hypothetical protein